MRALTPCQVFASTPHVRLLFDGTPHPGPGHNLHAVSQLGYLDLRTGGNSTWGGDCPPALADARNVTVVAVDEGGAAVARHSLLRPANEHRQNKAKKRVRGTFSCFC